MNNNKILFYRKYLIKIKIEISSKCILKYFRKRHKITKPPSYPLTSILAYSFPITPSSPRSNHYPEFAIDPSLVFLTLLLYFVFLNNSSIFCMFLTSYKWYYTCILSKPVFLHHPPTTNTRLVKLIHIEMCDSDSLTLCYVCSTALPINIRSLPDFCYHKQCCYKYAGT